MNAVYERCKEGLRALPAERQQDDCGAGESYLQDHQQVVCVRGSNRDVLFVTGTIGMKRILLVSNVVARLQILKMPYFHDML